MAYDADYFLSGLSRQVHKMGGDSIVTVVLHSGGIFYLRDVVETHPGYVQLNVWHDSQGRPIQSPSSGLYNQEVPYGYHPVSVSFESISIVDVMSTTAQERTRIGFQIDTPNDSD